MIPLSSAASSGLSWSQIPHTRNYELTLQGQLVGTLLHPAVRSLNFIAETLAGRWTFHRGGWLGSGAEIVDSDSQQQIALLKSSWDGGGVLRFADGQTFHLECAGWWHPVWKVMGGNGRPVLQLRTRERRVEVISDGDVPWSRLSLLAMFILYRVLQAEEDAASAAMVA